MYARFVVSCYNLVVEIPLIYMSGVRLIVYIPQIVSVFAMLSEIDHDLFQALDNQSLHM